MSMKTAFYGLGASLFVALLLVSTPQSGGREQANSPLYAASLGDSKNLLTKAHPDLRSAKESKGSQVDKLHELDNYHHMVTFWPITCAPTCGCTCGISCWSLCPEKADP